MLAKENLESALGNHKKNGVGGGGGRGTMHFSETINPYIALYFIAF